MDEQRKGVFFSSKRYVFSGKTKSGRVLSTKLEEITAKPSEMELWEKTETAPSYSQAN